MNEQRANSVILSIIIPAFNEEDFLFHTISKIKYSIEEQNLDSGAWELIVCDNNSRDRTREIASDSGAIVIQESVRQISKVRNTGASIATGDWLLFMDADTYPNTELMAEVLQIIKEDKLIGCGSIIEVIDGSLFNKLRMERLNPFFRLFNISGGAFILSNKAGFEAIKGFSESLFAYEDLDFVFRLKKYSKTVGKRFKVLHRNPVMTSGRKGELTFPAMVRMMVSNFFAIILLILHGILPSQTIQKLGKDFLGYWYSKE